MIYPGKQCFKITNLKRSKVQASSSKYTDFSSILLKGTNGRIILGYISELQEISSEQNSFRLELCLATI